MGEPPPNLDLPIGEVVRRWREYHGWSVTDYAARAGVSKGYVSEVERMRIGQPKSPQLAKLAAPFGLTEWDLISRRLPSDGDTPTPPPAGLPRPAAPSAQGTVGERIDRVLSRTDLSADEQRVLAERLIAITGELVSLLRASRRLTAAESRR